MIATKECLPTYKGWNNIPKGFYTKTTLRRDFKLKPINENMPDAYVEAGRGRYKDTYNLYHVDNCIPLKKIIIRDLPLTVENIAKSLYLINKSAKKSRDTKSLNYQIGRHDIVSRSKQREKKLYELKDKVIRKLINDNLAVIKGYHTQTLKRKGYEIIDQFELIDNHAWDKLENYKQDTSCNICIYEGLNTIFGNFADYAVVSQYVERKITNTLIYIEVDKFSFHVPNQILNIPTDNLKFLGDIGIIPAESKKIDIKFNEAVRLLEKYIDQK